MRGASRMLLLLAGNIIMAQETLWLEAEHFDGLSGYCWPMGRPAMKVTNGAWGLSGPGWAAEWNQGGESGFLSIATSGPDDHAKVSKVVEIPVAGVYSIWVRYGDWRESPEPFEVGVEQAGAEPQTGLYGRHPRVGEDAEPKLYWDWAFAWDVQTVDLQAGPATVTLMTSTTAPQPRQVDVIVLTTDSDYRPLVKNRPANPSWQFLEQFRDGIVGQFEPLARKLGQDYSVPGSWPVKTFRDRGFLYLWNVSGDWLGDESTVRVPHQLRDADALKEFAEKYAGRDDIPIFSDPRIVPTFHGAGPAVFMTEPETGEVGELGKKFAAWLDANPDRCWAMMMNYAPDKPIGAKGIAAFLKYRDRYVGSIAGESLGYFYPAAAEMQRVTAAATTRRELAAAFVPLSLDCNAAKYRTIFGGDFPGNPFADVISCLSVGNIVWAPFCADWGARTIGYESAAITSSILGMRWAFIRGIARQRGAGTATYRSCNFGDSATIFSNNSSYHSPQSILDNYYSVYSGAGMTWYKFDIWYQYMAGSSMFYHEQGFDEFWKPGGTTAAGVREVQLSPKGKLVDRFLRLTRENFDRGTPYTPVAFLVDYAHGWEPSPYWPNSFKDWQQQPDRFRFADHEKMLEQYFWAAYHPIGPESEKPITATNEVYVPGVFGDIFDVVAAYPDPAKWTTIDTYPVVVIAGELELTSAEGRRLSQYVTDGGTLLLADVHVSGAGLSELKLPQLAESAVAENFFWLDESGEQPSPRFHYRPIGAAADQRVLARVGDQPICIASDRGAGRLIYLSIPHGLTISKRLSPIVSRLLLHLTRGLMPVEVQGDVNWLINRNQQGWLVTLINPAGQLKYQQGIAPPDYRENRTVTIVSRVPVSAATDLLLPTEPLEVIDNRVQTTVRAGDLRIVQLR